MRPKLKVDIKKFWKRGNYSLDLWHFGFSDSVVFSEYSTSAIILNWKDKQQYGKRFPTKLKMN